jgi:hypothetical protein
VVRGVRGGGYLGGARSGERVPEEGPADAGSAECGINDEELNEVPAEEVSWLDDDEAGHGSVGDQDLALSGRQAAPQELGPLGSP